MPCKTRVRKHMRTKKGRKIKVKSHNRRVKGKKIKKRSFLRGDRDKATFIAGKRWMDEISEQEKIPKEELFLSNFPPEDKEKWTKGSLYKDEDDPVTGDYEPSDTFLFDSLEQNKKTKNNDW